MIPVAGGLSRCDLVGYMVVAALEVAAQCGAGPRMNSAIDVAAEHLEECVIDWGPESPPGLLAKRIARLCTAASPTIARRRPHEPIASAGRRSSTSTASSRRSRHELPELDHDEIGGWDGAAGARAGSPPSSSRTPTRTRASWPASR